MGEVIAVINQKGGCGKTTTNVNLATSLALLDKKVLVIDLDPQGNATTAFGIEKSEIENTSYTLLIKESSITETMIPYSIEGLYVVPSNIGLSGAERELGNLIGSEFILDEVIQPVKDNFDYIFVDVPPSLGLLTLNAIYAADSVIIPIQAEFYALEGMIDLLKTINLVEDRLKSETSIKGILITLYDSRTNLARDVVADVKEFFEGKEYIFKTKIPRNIKLAEAPSRRKPCIIYDPESVGTEAYVKLAKEIIEMDG